jgi:mRNA-degrading endonuclease toxin of MazEF toxin-antitoxin module
MRVQQGDIVEVNFLLPNGEFKPHPVIVLSNNEVNEYEDAFVCVMLSSTAPDDNFSYWLDDKMLTLPQKRPSQVRCQLISLLPENQVIQKFGSIRKNYLKELYLKINECVFSID